MAALLNLTAFDAILKEHYTPERVKKLAFTNHPLLGMIPKMESMTGKKYVVPIAYGTPQGTGAAFLSAQAAKRASDFEAWELTRVQGYGFIDIDNETMEASMGDLGAFMEARQQEIDGLLDTMARNIALDLYGNGYGVRGRIAAVSTTLVTLTNKEDAINFEVGMRITVSASNSTPGAGALRGANVSSGDGDSGEFVTLVAVDRSAGTITADANWTTVFGAGDAGGAAAVNDYLHRWGDKSFGTAATRRRMSGLEAWIPASAPSSTAFFGVDRSVDTDRLGGIRVDGSAMTVEEALIEGGTRAFIQGGTPDTCLMNPVHFGELVKSLGSKVNYDVAKSSDGQIGFKTVGVWTPAGYIKCVPDPDCPKGRALLLDMGTVKLYSLGGAPKLLSHDGLIALRNSTSDSVEVRAGFYGQLGVSAPGRNVRIALAT